MVDRVKGLITISGNSDSYKTMECYDKDVKQRIKYGWREVSGVYAVRKFQ